jgi:predicted metal-dependent hydrolase
VHDTDRDIRTVRIDHADLAEVDVVVRRSARTRNVRLHVDERGQITVSAPHRLAGSRIDAIVRERASWLVDVRQRMELATRTTEIDLRRGDPVRLLGSWRPSRLVELPHPGRRARVLEEPEGTIVVTIGAGADPWEALHRWYRQIARTVLSERTAYWANRYGLAPGRITIRDQRTRWGSCTEQGDLSFNWRLVLAPMWVLDAIVVHELCHLDELNHSDRFWALLDRRFPRHTEASEWLKVHGPSLRVTAPQVDDAHGVAVRPRRGRTVTDQQTSLFNPAGH